MTKEDAIEYLEKLYMIADFTDEYGDMDDTEPYETALNMAIEALQHKTGKWIRKGMSINCSVCKKCGWSLTFEDTVRRFNYCPNCGVRMECEEE